MIHRYASTAFGVMLFCALSSSPAFAWSQKAHEIVAYVAAQNLSPVARQEVGSLLGGSADEAMVRNANWAGSIRAQNLLLTPWFFVDIPIGSKGYDPTRDCPKGMCIVAQVLRDEALLSDPHAPEPVRATALKFLIYFVADLHQPLHVSNNDDRGGNAVSVLLKGRSKSLHQVWDDDVVQYVGSDPHKAALRLNALTAPEDKIAWSTGDAIAWTNQTYSVAESSIYPELSKLERKGGAILLPPDYVDAHGKDTAKLLERAGLRLAKLVNEALSSSPSVPN